MFEINKTPSGLIEIYGKQTDLNLKKGNFRETLLAEWQTKWLLCTLANFRHIS